MMKSQLKKKKINSRPLTKSEKFLLTILTVVLLVWGSNKFILTPQAEKLAVLESSKLDYEMKIVDMNNTLKSEEKINKEWEILHQERDQILSQYFPTLDQSQIIYLLNDLTEDDKFSAEDLNFSRPSTEKVGEIDVRKMEISIPFVGNYSGIIDVINAVGGSPRRILVDSLSLDRKDEKDLAGTMSLKIYSLEGLAQTNPDVIYVDTATNSGEGVPFQAYKDYKEEASGGSSGGSNTGTGVGSDFTSPDTKDGMRKELLHEFDYRSYNFIPSGTMVQGNVAPSTIKKSGKYSLRFEYNILALDDENRAYIDLSNPEINIKYPPESIGTWVYSYGYSPGTLGMRLRTQGGEFVDITMSEGISWMGWSYVETSLPADLKLYPLKLEKLYFELPYNRDDFGILLIDKMEAFYGINEGTTTRNNETYIFYVVEPGDTVSNISRKFYGDLKYKNEIMSLNDIRTEDILPVGKVLVLRRR